MFTKTQTSVMEIFVSKIDRKFSIKEIADMLKKPYPLIHRSIKSLIQDGFILRDNKELLSLNYKENQAELAYIEALRSKKALDKDKIMVLFAKDVNSQIDCDFYIFIIFGSYVEKNNPRDIDILFIVENESKVNEIERILENIASKFTKKFEVQVISVKSTYEMLAKRDKINIMNETLNKHILLFGAENYYKVLKNAR